jgi:hypothetical protein
VRARIKSRSNSASPAQNSQHQAAVRRRRVGPCVAERSETGFAIGDRRERVQQVARRSRQPVEPRHHQHVAGVELVEYATKLCALGLDPARHFAEHHVRPVLPQIRDLSGDALPVGRYPRLLF